MDSYWRWDYIFRRSPLSLNNAFPQGASGRRFPSKDLKEFKKSVSEELQLQDRHRGKPPKSDFYLATWVFCYPRFNSLSENARRVLKLPPDGMFFKNGKLQRKDVSNFFKAPEDVLFNYLDIVDDTQVLSLHGYKRVVPPGRFNKPFFLLFLSPELEAGPIYHGSERICLDEWAERVDHCRI